jgi:hypothetical protein
MIEPKNMFYAKFNSAKTIHVLMQRKLTINDTKIMKVLSGKLCNLTENDQMMIARKYRRNLHNKSRILCSSSNVIYRLLCCCCFVIIVIVTVIPTKCMHFLVTA